MLTRCYSICLDYTLFHLKVEKLSEIFKKNSYPSSVIKLSIRFFLYRLYVPKQIYSTAPKTELLIILSFLGTMPLNLTGKLQTSLRNSLTQCNIKVISKSTNHLSFLFRLKDVIPKEFSHLVYKLSCSSFNATYYGKTERHLNVRSGEHVGLSTLTGKRVACKPSAIYDHLLLHEHNNSDLNDFSILCCENNGFKLSSAGILAEFRFCYSINYCVHCIITTNGI